MAQLLNDLIIPILSWLQLPDKLGCRKVCHLWKFKLDSVRDREWWNLSEVDFSKINHHFSMTGVRWLMNHTNILSYSADNVFLWIAKNIDDSLLPSYNEPILLRISEEVSIIKNLLQKCLSFPWDVKEVCLFKLNLLNIIASVRGDLFSRLFEYNCMQIWNYRASNVTHLVSRLNHLLVCYAQINNCDLNAVKERGYFPERRELARCAQGFDNVDLFLQLRADILIVDIIAKWKHWSSSHKIAHHLLQFCPTELWLDLPYVQRVFLFENISTTHVDIELSKLAWERLRLRKQMFMDKCYDVCGIGFVRHLLHFMTFEDVSKILNGGLCISGDWEWIDVGWYVHTFSISFNRIVEFIKRHVAYLDWLSPRIFLALALAYKISVPKSLLDRMLTYSLCLNYHDGGYDRVDWLVCNCVISLGATVDDQCKSVLQTYSQFDLECALQLFTVTAEDVIAIIKSVSHIDEKFLDTLHNSLSLDEKNKLKAIPFDASCLEPTIYNNLARLRWIHKNLTIVDPWIIDETAIDKIHNISSLCWIEKHLIIASKKTC